MALPIREFVASQAVEGAVQKARVLRDNVQAWKTKIDTSPTTADLVINAMQGIKSMRDVLASYAAIGGLNEAAKLEYNDPTLVMTTELNAIVAACDACLSWVNANFPKDGSGYLLDRKIVGGVIEWRTFSVATLSGLSTQFGLLLAAFS
jgi:hypothetical protein